MHCDYKGDDKWCIKRLIGRKHISQVEQSNIECKEEITEQEKIDKEQRP